MSSNTIEILQHQLKLDTILINASNACTNTQVKKTDTPSYVCQKETLLVNTLGPSLLVMNSLGT